MEIICIYTQAHTLAGGVGPERACDSATGGSKYGNHFLHIHLVPCVDMGVWGLKEPATVRQVDPNMEIICIYTQAHTLAGGVGPERACDSATGGSKYGNHFLHIHLVPCVDMGVWGLKEPATVRQVDPNMEFIFLHIHLVPCVDMGVWGLKEPATVQQVCPNMENICI
jgi:hypothetical protein